MELSGRPPAAAAALAPLAVAPAGPASVTRPRGPAHAGPLPSGRLLPPLGLGVFQSPWLRRPCPPTLAPPPALLRLFLPWGPWAHADEGGAVGPAHQ